MIKIAICDDEPLYLEKIKKYLTDVDGSNEFEISAFRSGEELLSGYTPGLFDIIILDIEMDGMNGLEAAERIRRKDEDVLLMFLTSHSEFAIDGYAVNAYRYMLKGESDYLCMRQIESIISEYKQSVSALVVESKGSTISCRYKDIFYLEVLNKTAILHKRDSSVEFPGRISELEDRLSGSDFVRTHKSYIVNLANVDYLEAKEVLLNNGKRVPIGRKYKDALTESYIKFMGSK